MQEEKKIVKTSHNVIMENRKQMTISGVRDVDSFDESSVALYTELGDLLISGADLHINKLNIENGEVVIKGEIEGLEYRSSDAKKVGFFSRLVK